MGCASSKQKRCRHCQAPYSPVPRSYSMEAVHPPRQKGDSYHMVALTSTTLGSIMLDSLSNQSGNGTIDAVVKRVEVDDDELQGNVFNGGEVNGIVSDKELKNKEFSMGLIEAKTWSNMIEPKISKFVPRTPVMTPPGEPETINIWELMAGLEEEVSPPPHLATRNFRSFSFDVSRDPSPVVDSPKLKLPQENSTSSPSKRSMWHQIAEEEDANSMKSPEFDPEVISTFRKSLEELSPHHPFYLKPLDSEVQPPLASSDCLLDVNVAKKVNNCIVEKDSKCRKDKVVVYFTSLRGVRKTYEDCCHVRVILKGLGVRVDERDVSMHSGFKEELKELLGEGFFSGGLPRVFVGRKYIGAAEEIRQMHDEGQLGKVIEDCEMLDDGDRCGGVTCEACGDIRFVPCETCSGSCKIYYEEEEEEQEEREEGEGGCGDYGFQRCPDCNENGLIRCPICCDEF